MECRRGFGAQRPGFRGRKPRPRLALNFLGFLAFALAVSPLVHAQHIAANFSASAEPAGQVHSAAGIRNLVLSKPIGVGNEIAGAARDFVMFHDPQWSALTIAQIAAGTADAVTSLRNLRDCQTCIESGVSRFFVGAHPDAHKYIVGGIFEIGIEAVTAHYFRDRRRPRKWYTRALWTLPQSFSLYEHALAADQNAAVDLSRGPAMQRRR
jgi:hypothetical protein